MTVEMFRETILSTDDDTEWLEILSHLKNKDIFYEPQYLKIYERETRMAPFMHFGGQGQLFVYGDKNNFIIYPFFKRSVANLHVADVSLNNMYDIISPYGYGGPLAQIADESIRQPLWQGFFKSFDTYCQENKIISEFSRLHPLFENVQPINEFAPGITQKVGQIVYIDLSYSEEKILKDMEHSHRRRIKNALNNPDLSFGAYDLGNQAKLFYKLYNENMQRISADNIYHFSQEFFEAAFLNLGEHINFWQVSYNGNISAGWLILKYGTQAFAWLSGSRKEDLRVNPNNLLVYLSCIKLKKEGFKQFNLGGGKITKAGETDTLFDFKSGFSKLRKDFYIYKRIHLKPEYDRLVALRNQQNATVAEFFPQYRSRNMEI